MLRDRPPSVKTEFNIIHTSDWNDMHNIAYTKFITSEGYWFNVIQVGSDAFVIFNTQRKLDQISRDGIGYNISHDNFSTLEAAKRYLEELE